MVTSIICSPFFMDVSSVGPLITVFYAEPWMLRPGLTVRKKLKIYKSRYGASGRHASKALRRDDELSYHTRGNFKQNSIEKIILASIVK